MKRYVIYECEECGKRSKIYDEIFECEAKHIGLTVKEMVEYTDLKEKVKIRSNIVSRTNNEKTRSDLDKTIEELIEFEEKLNIKSGTLQVLYSLILN